MQLQNIINIDIFYGIKAEWLLKFKIENLLIIDSSNIVLSKYNCINI